MPASKNMPLELLLQKYAADRGAEFPNRDTNYFERYSVIKDHVATNYYRSTGTGLGMTEKARFTHHDITHVDDVILAAGHLLGLKADLPAEPLSQPSTPPYAKLHPYEVYVLLMAALLHDAGNAAGRDNHEQRAGQIIRDFGNVAQVPAVEGRLIASIARAHGGKLADGDKDTITKVLNEVAPMEHIEVHAQRLAAIVRLADELSENNRRADAQALKRPYDAPHSVLHNLYCHMINTQIRAESHSVAITFCVEKEYLAEELSLQEGGTTRSVLVVDYIAERLNKTELERRYCNRFLTNFASCDRIIVTLEVLDGYDVIDTIYVDLTDRGYPSLATTVKDLEPRFDGVTLRDKHQSLSEVK